MREQVIQKSKRRERIFRYAPLVLWIGVIFYLSSGQGSMSETSRFIRPFLEWLLSSAAPETVTYYHGFIRKFAHFFVYAMLAFWSWRALRNSSVESLRNFWYLFSLALVLMIAATDEINQSFNKARTGSIYDVLLDFTGGLTIVLILSLISFSTNRRSAENI